MTLDSMIELDKAWKDGIVRANDATYMGNSKELSAAWYDLDMIRDAIEQECNATPGELQRQLNVWREL